MPQISLHGLTMGVSNYGGNVQRVKDTMYYLQEENKTLVRLDLNCIRELIFGGLEDVSSAMQTINNTVNCFAVSKLVRSQVYYVKGLNELWLNDKQLPNVQLANGDERMNTLACTRSNLVIPIFK